MRSDQGCYASEVTKPSLTWRLRSPCHPSCTPCTRRWPQGGLTVMATKSWAQVHAPLPAGLMPLSPEPTSLLLVLATLACLRHLATLPQGWLFAFVQQGRSIPAYAKRIEGLVLTSVTKGWKQALYSKWSSACLRGWSFGKQTLLGCSHWSVYAAADTVDLDRCRRHFRAYFGPQSMNEVSQSCQNKYHFHTQHLTAFVLLTLHGVQHVGLIQFACFVYSHAS